MKDYNTRVAINVPEDENVKMVSMGNCTILDKGSKEHLLTYGLGPCVGVSVVIRNRDKKIFRLLAHVDMGQIIGVSFESLQSYFRRMKNSVSNGIESVEISLSSTQSFLDINSLNDKETKLLAIILREFQEYGINIENIKFNYSSQVQISPKGVISNYSEYELEQHRQYMMESSLSEYGGYVHPSLNIYITNFGAWMGNCLLGLDCSNEETRKELLGRYWQEYISKGYNLVVAPSFNNPQCQAVYVSNWQEKVDSKYGVVIGCPQAKQQRDLFDITKTRM